MKMRIFNIIVSFAIVALNIYVSFNHTLTLFQDGGFAKEGLLSFLRIDLASVIAAELVFFMGCVNIINSHIQNRPAGYPAYLTSVLGVILIGWSNVYAQWEYGFMGFVLGLSVPVGIVLSELMFSHSIASYHSSKEIESTQKTNEEHTTKIEEPQKNSEEKIEVTIKDEESHTSSQENEIKNESETTVHNKSEDSQKKIAQKERTTKNADQVAWELFEKSDRRKLPKIKDIEEIAGVSPWEARTARNKLKKELKVS